jgi:tetratricopeptide (TPR) repeat protein
MFAAGPLTRAGRPAKFTGAIVKKPPVKPVPPPPPPARRWLIALAAIVIVGTTVAAYHNSFSGALVFDDEPAVLDNPTIRQLWPVWRAWAPPPDRTVTGRPLANFTLALNHAVSGTHVGSYHAFNLLVHVLAGLTLFGLVRRTLQLRSAQALIAVGRGRRTPPQDPESAAFGDAALQSNATLLAFTVALLWTLHPLQVEAVTYVIQRVESLMALFFLLVFYCFVRSVESPRTRLWQTGAVAACLLGAATKEVIAVAPVLLLFYDRAFVAGSFREAWRQRRGLYLALAATWLLLAGLVASAGWDRNGTSGFDVGIAPAAYWLTQFQAVTRYLWLSVWPHPLVFEYGTFWESGAAAVVPYAIPVVALAVVTLVALWRRPVVGFLGGWFFAILAPTSVIPGRIQMIVEHRMYLPLAAVIALVVGAVTLRAGRRGFIAFLALAAGLAWLTERRNDDYRSGIVLWHDTVAKRPKNARAHNCLGVVLFKAGRTPEAIQSYETALRLQPVYPEAHNNLGYALTEAGRIPEAIKELEIALRMEPDYAIAHNNFGNALLQAGRPAEAIAHYQAALRIKPDFALAHYDLGNALLAAGRTAAAVQSYEAALRWEPDNADTEYNLGNALFTAGRIPEAIAHYQTALRIKPDSVEAHSNLGSALLQLGRTPEAIAEFAAALRVKPDYAEGHNNLGAALYHAGRIPEAIREFETALRLKPGYPDARENLERMRALAPAAAGARPAP